MTDARIVLTTVGTEEEATRIADELVTCRHAACVNVLPGVRSAYRWKGKICHDSEFMLVIKTLDSELEAVSELIREHHSYELPEILALPIDRGERGFLAWIADSLDKEADFSDESDDDLELDHDDPRL